MVIDAFRLINPGGGGGGMGMMMMGQMNQEPRLKINSPINQHILISLIGIDKSHLISAI